MCIRVHAICASWMAIVLSSLTLAYGEDAQAISPKNAVQLFNGKNFDGLYTWMEDSKYEDPRKVFTVEDGMIHISGDGFGYVCTKQRYKDYHLVVEYRWGDKTWRSRKTQARDSGVIVHCVDPDGSCSNRYMAGIEAQIIEGGTGDFWIVPGKRADGSIIPVSLTVETAQDRDGETIWKKGGERKVFDSAPIQWINWFGKDPDWADVLGFRGKQDIESPGKEWTRLDVICDGGHIMYRVNGVQANEGFDAVPSAGKILIQTEGAELYVRRFELLPLPAKVGVAGGEGITLAESGQTRYQIVIGQQAKAPVRAAAEELAEHLQQITGVRFQVVSDEQPPAAHEIVVGPSKRLAALSSPIEPAELAPESYVIRTDGDRLFIVGGSRNGTLNGVYVFLEEILGCRWYSPDCSVIPQQPSLRLQPLDLRGRPPFEARVLIEHRGSNAANPDWAAHMRLNGVVMSNDPRHQEVIHWAGPFCHSLASLVPSSLFETHPEYFSEIDGKRIKENSQVCMTNPGAIATAVATAKQWLAQHPTATYVSVTHNDCANYCRCKECAAVSKQYGVTGTWLRFVNAIAEELEKDYPRILVDTFAYEWTVEPPRNVKPRRNVIIRYAPIESCSYHAYDDPKCELNVKWHTAEWLKTWRAISERVQVWCYLLEGASLQPYPGFECLQANFRLFREMGINGFSTFQLRPHGATFYMHGLKSYLVAKLMWNPEYDVRQGMEEFCRAYYGPAGQEMLDYVRESQDEGAYQRGSDGRPLQEPVDHVAVGLPERINRGLSWFPPRHSRREVPGFHLDFTTAPTPRPEMLRRWDAAFERMEKRVAGDPVLLQRVRAERLCILWCSLMFLPPADPVHQQARQQFLPAATAAGGVWIPDLRASDKLWLTPENVKMLQRDYPELCPL